MARGGGASRLVWLRRGVQTAFLLLFLYLFLQTADHPINRVEELLPWNVAPALCGEDQIQLAA